MARLARKSALVTGAGAGLGRAIALRFGAEGAHVLAVSDKAQELKSLTAEARAAQSRITVFKADVADSELAEKAVRLVEDQIGQLDILVNNAGIIAVKPIEETTPELWDRILATNLRGPFLYARASVPLMKQAGGGMIVNVTSQSGIRGFVGETAYCASKFGLEGLSQTLAIELAPWRIRVVTVTPGAPMNTPMSATTYDAEARSAWREPAEFTEAFVRLATEPDEFESGGRYDAWALSTAGALVSEREGDLL